MRRIVDFVSGFATEVTAAASKVVLEAIRDRLPSALATDRLKVDGSGVTQPVSGSVTATISGTPAVTVSSGSVAVSSLPGVSGTVAVSSSALPTGAATDPLQTSGTVSAATTATQTTTTATNTGTIAGAVSASDATLPASAVQIAGVGQSTAPTAVTAGRAVRAWFSLIGAQMVGLLGANGSAIASATNAVPVGGKDSGGTSQTVLVSAAGIVQVQSATGTASTSTAQEASRVISASACSVSRAAMQNASASTRYLQLHDATSLPANGAVPEAVIIIGTTQTQVMTWSHPNNRFTTGCVAATSSTGPTLTIGSADAIFQVDLFPASA